MMDTKTRYFFVAVHFNYYSTVSGCCNAFIITHNNNFPSEPSIKQDIIKLFGYPTNTSIVILSACEFTEEQYKQFKEIP